MQLIQRPIPLLLFFVSLWLLVFWPTLAEMERVWRGSDTYMHCYVVPLIAAWLAMQKKQSLSLQPSWLWLAFFVAFILLWLVGFAADVNTVSQFSAVLCLQFLLFAMLSPKSRKDYRFPLFFLIFLVPFGDEFNPLLQDITAVLTVDILRFIDVPVYREGLFLTTTIGHFEVAEACSGLRFLVASVVIGSLYAYLTYTSRVRQLLFVAILIAVSILANGLRAALLIWLAEISNYKLGFGEDHYLYGWIVFGLTLFGMFWLGGYFAQPTADSAALSSATPSSTTAMQIEAQTPSNKGKFSLLLPVIATCCLAGAGVFRSQLIGITPPVTPAVLTAPDGFKALASTPTQLNALGTTFFDGLARLDSYNNDGEIFFTAHYAAKQTKGEMISWDNRVFNPKLWAVLEQQVITLPHGEALYLQIKLNESTRSLLVWYEVDEQHVSKPQSAKLYQLYSLLFGLPGLSQVVVYSVPGNVDAEQMLTSAKTLKQTTSQLYLKVSPKP